MPITDTFLGQFLVFMTPNILLASVLCAALNQVGAGAHVCAPCCHINAPTQNEVSWALRLVYARTLTLPCCPPLAAVDHLQRLPDPLPPDAGRLEVDEPHQPHLLDPVSIKWGAGWRGLPGEAWRLNVGWAGGCASSSAPTRGMVIDCNHPPTAPTPPPRRYGLGGSQLCDSQVPFIGIGSAPNQTVGEFMSEYFDYQESMIWWCLLIVLAYVVAFRAGAVLLLRHISFLKR